jgi:putative Holliday junction resolvase
MNAGKLLCIDHGIKRIGLAVCDGSRLVARELMVIKRKSKREDFDLINRIAEEQGVVGIVVGLPSNFDMPPDEYTQEDTVRLWTERFAVTTNLPIAFWDEQLSSEDAKVIARQKKRKLTDPIDDLAARIILQSYLDALKDDVAPPIA